MKLLGEFERVGDVVERRFTKSETRMLTNLTRQIAETMSVADAPASYDDVVVRRLLPDAYPDDLDANAEYSAAVRSRLADAKAAGAMRVAADLAAAPGGTVRLDRDGAIEWLRALGDIRLALASRVGVEVLQSDVTAPAGMLYAWLTWLQGSLVDAVDLGDADLGDALDRD